MERAIIRASVVMAKNLKTALKSSGGAELASIMPDGVLVMDVNGIIRYANKRAAGLLGQTPRDLIGTWFGIPTPANEEVEVELRKVGRRRTLATMTSVRASLSGVPVYIATLRETSDQNRMRQELLLEKAEAEEKSDQKTAFMADLSHEMRTPLNAIVGFSEMMSAEMFGPLGHDKYREYAGDIRECGEHLLRLINDLLDLSKAEAGKLELQVSTSNVAVLAAESLQLVSALAAEKEIRTRIDVPAVRMRVDPLKLRQILLNLLSNAIKFTPRGGKVELRGSLSKSGAVRLRVIDSGIGMDEAQLAGVFEPYRQLHKRRDVAEGEDGTGLGLALTKRLVELHGGEIRIDSAPGEGTTVTVILPAERVVRPRRPVVH